MSQPNGSNARVRVSNSSNFNFTVGNSYGSAVDHPISFARFILIPESFMQYADF